MIATKTKIQSLIAETSALSAKHKKIASTTGERFNIFSILRVESKETSMHSAFLVELLNPRGSHGQGDVFLDLFVEVLGKNKALEIDLDVANATAYKEKYVGPINKERTEGGKA